MADNESISNIHNSSIDIKQREIYLHGHTAQADEDPGVDFRMATTLIKNLRILDSINQNIILIHMHSVGGNWNDGMAIFDAVSACKSHIIMLVYGQAESMSSIILQAADTRIMMPNAYFMCHFGSNSLGGNYLDVQSAAKFDERLLGRMLDIYAEVAMGGPHFTEAPTSKSKVKSYIKNKFKGGDWYLTAQEAVEYGFADSVLSDTIDNVKYSIK